MTNSPQTNPETLRLRLERAVPDDWSVVYLKHEDKYLIGRKGASGASGIDSLRRRRSTVEKWRNPERTIAFAVKHAERSRS